MLLATLALAFLAYFAVGGVIATRLTRRVRPRLKASPADFDLDFEDVRIPARDGLPIAGWFIPHRGATRALLMVHGLWMSRAGEFDGRWLECAARLHARGYALLLIDLRAHGDSGGKNFTLGVQERRDVLGAADWLRGRGFARVGVLGVSLGAGSAIEAAADDPAALDAIVADGAFADMRDLLDRHFARLTGLPGWLLPGGVVMTRLLHGTDLNAVKPAERAGGLRAPLLLIHSDGDRLIPRTHFDDLRGARPDAEEWLVPTSKHARIYNDHADEYIARVAAFFDAHLGGATTSNATDHHGT